MSGRNILGVFAITALLAAPSLASVSGSRPEPPSTPSGTPASMPISESALSTPRQEAQKAYAAAYEELGKAKQELTDGKAKNLPKRYKHALEDAQRAVALDGTYYEAWNLIGYCARKLGDYDQAFAAYEKCLSLKFDYGPAREYLGEAWLEKNEPRKARDQLVLLEKFGAADDAKTLRSQIEAWEAAHPGAVRADSSAAPADTAAKAASSGR